MHGIAWGARERVRRNVMMLVALAAVAGSCAGGGDSGGPLGNAGGGASTCAPITVDPTRYLRQLSMDLRGRPPTVDELERVRQLGEVPQSTIDAMLESPEFLEQARVWHRALLWPNLDGFRVQSNPLIGWDADPGYGGRRIGSTYSPDPALVDDAAAHPRGVVSFSGMGGGDRQLRGGTYQITGCDGTLLYPTPAARGTPQPTYRVTGTDGRDRTYPYYDADGVPLPYHDATHCPNYCTRLTPAQRADSTYRQVADDYAAMDAMGAAAAPEELDPAGRHCPDAYPTRIVNPCDNTMYNGADTVRRERRDGYRVVQTYWSRGRDVRVCAYEAQDREFSAGTGNSCAARQLSDPSCGCGPEGRFCMPVVSYNSGPPSRTEFRVHTALNEEPMEIVASVIGRNEDYFEIFTTRRSFVTGPMAYFYRNQVDSARGLEIGLPASLDAIPAMAYADEQWREFVRNPEHAGVLTTPAYLGRFATWRARVSQFRTAFMCRPFSPATTALPSSDDPCTREPNLARRCGCQNCHAAIEPMTAWFGRWAERSTRFLPPSEYPQFDPNCQQCALRGVNCTTRCRTQYVVDTIDADGSRYAGTLRGYLYRTPVEVDRIDEGPRGLVANAIASGELQNCTVRTAWSRLLGRPMGEDEMRSILPGLVGQFNDSHHNYRALVRAIVTSIAYRRVD